MPNCGDAIDASMNYQIYRTLVQPKHLKVFK